MAERLKVYLDTSVISYLEQEDAPERMSDTRQLWQDFMCRPDLYDVYLSELTIRELQQAPKIKALLFLNHIQEVSYHLIRLSMEMRRIAERIVELGILRRKSFDDAMHIAAALVEHCDCIVSWNFKHLVNFRTVRGVRAVALLEGQREIDIVSPLSLLQYARTEQEGYDGDA